MSRDVEARKAYMKEYSKKYRAIHKEKLSIEKKKWFEKNREKTNKKSKLYVKNNPDKRKETNRKYLVNHKDQINSYRRNRLSDESKRQSVYIAGRIRYALNNNQEIYKNNYLGCTIAEYRVYLEGKFTKGMSWSNYGFFGWHIDHIKPISLFDLTNEEERYLCFNYKNTQPLWCMDNILKSNKYELESVR